jgi:hypothetical protein
LADDEQGRITANYKGNYERLVDVKGTYDPGDLFHLKPEHSRDGMSLPRPGLASDQRASVVQTAAMSSSADGFSRLERSPRSSPVTMALIALLMTFAERVRGRSRTKSTRSGLKARPRRDAT